MLGKYLIVGRNCPPTVVILDNIRDRAFADAVGLASKRDSDEMRRAVYKSTFGVPAEYVFCTAPDVMEILAVHYDGPHRSDVRIACARLALGLPTRDGDSDDPNPPDEPEGGRKTALVPEKPITPRPGGAANKLPSALDLLRSA